MRSTTLSKLRCNAASTLRPIINSRRAVIRNSSTEASPLQASLHAELTSRPVNRIIERISPTPWHLLNITLAGFLPPSCYQPGFDPSNLEASYATTKFSQNDGFQGIPAVPQGHHLIYFSPQVLNGELLADGTDSLHSPGAPFVRRLWAGGSVIFNREDKQQLKLAEHHALCGEDITDVQVKGKEGEEKVFVTVRRRIANLPGSGRSARINRRLLMTMDKEKPVGSDEFMGILAIQEERNLVFLREKSKEQAREDLEKVGRIIKPIHSPDFSVSLTPTPAMLFRFSALSFNAHKIHIDPQYTREVEGHRNLLVHGPLSLVLMLSVLRSQLKDGEMVLRFDYKNLAPLYAEEEMKICVRKNPDKENKFDIWIQGRDGGYAVKGTAVVGWRGQRILLDPGTRHAVPLAVRKV